MRHCEGSFAVCRVTGAAGGIDVGVRCAADGHMRVPDPNIARVGAGHVHLQDDGTRRDVGDCKAHILDLRDTDIAGVADLYDGLGVVGVAEKAADARYHGPSLSDNASPGGDKECRLDDINAVRDVS